jgi:hypothetical protein
LKPEIPSSVGIDLKLRIDTHEIFQSPSDNFHWDMIVDTGKYSIKKLLRTTKAGKLSEYVTLIYSKGNPLQLRYSLKSMGSLTYLVFETIPDDDVDMSIDDVVKEEPIKEEPIKEEQESKKRKLTELTTDNPEEEGGG